MSERAPVVACGHCDRRFRRASDRRGGHIPPHKCPHGKRCSPWRASECSICESVAEGQHAARGACIFCDHPEGYDVWIETRKAKGLRVPDCYMPPPRPCRHRSEAEAAQLADEVACGVSDVFAPLARALAAPPRITGLSPSPGPPLNLGDPR